jgi:hypothetical protein
MEHRVSDGEPDYFAPVSNPRQTSVQMIHTKGVNTGRGADGYIDFEASAQRLLSVPAQENPGFGETELASMEQIRTVYRGNIHWALWPTCTDDYLLTVFPTQT